MKKERRVSAEVVEMKRGEEGWVGESRCPT